MKFSTGRKTFLGTVWKNPNAGHPNCILGALELCWPPDPQRFGHILTVIGFAVALYGQFSFTCWTNPQFLEAYLASKAKQFFRTEIRTLRGSLFQPMKTKCSCKFGLVVAGMQSYCPKLFRRRRNGQGDTSLLLLTPFPSLCGTACLPLNKSNPSCLSAKKNELKGISWQKCLEP